MDATSIPGLRYISEYVDSTAQARLLEDVDAQQWLRSVDHGVQIYGYGYNHRDRAAVRVGNLPPWVSELGTQLFRDRLMPRIPDQMVANNYEPGTGIFSHVDQAVFGDTVVSVSLGSACVMEFGSETGEKRDLLLEPRSVLVLSGDARWTWTHGIPARTTDIWDGEERPRSRRVSLTFRCVGS